MFFKVTHIHSYPFHLHSQTTNPFIQLKLATQSEVKSQMHKTTINDNKNKLNPKKFQEKKTKRVDNFQT